tara:strand:+ start:20694 stop:23711 length:3018 start_codon:yes stop_codon:yes gene_type:complete
MDTNKLLFGYILFISSVLHAEEVNISGVVQDSVNNPIRKAQIQLLNTKNVVLMEEETGRKGDFLLKKVKPDYYYISIKYDGEQVIDKINSESNSESVTRETFFVKLNPGSMKKNKSLNLQIVLPPKTGEMIVYSFAGTGPIVDHDPVLNLNPPSFEISPEKIIVLWEDIKFASSFVLYENGNEIKRDSLNRYELNTKPGKEFCYQVQAYDRKGFSGLITGPICVSAPTKKPRDVQIVASRNNLILKWSNVNGAESYNIYRDSERIGAGIDTISFQDFGLEYGKDYLYSVSAMDSMQNESQRSVEIKGTTHQYVPAPILSSVKDKDKLVLIWNEVELAKSFNIYRDGEFIENVQGTSFSEVRPPGESHCYIAKSVDQYALESDPSNTHCAKVEILPPKNVTADGGVNKIFLNWKEVRGAVSYNIYQHSGQDSTKFVKNVTISHLIIDQLPYGEEFCFTIIGVDQDGDLSKSSIKSCANVLTSPNFLIQRFELVEPSGNNILDPREKGKMRFAVHNNGQSPASNLVLKISSNDSTKEVMFNSEFKIDTLLPDKIQFAEFGIEADLTVSSGDRFYFLGIKSENGISLEEPYKAMVRTKKAIPSRMIISDFSITNDFGTHYIPSEEEVKLSLRVQNVGEGVTEYVMVEIPDSSTFSTPGFSGRIKTSPVFAGEYVDVEIPIFSKKKDFIVNIQLTDYLNVMSSHQLNLNLLRHYKHPEDMVSVKDSLDNTLFATSLSDDVDVDSDIPFGRKNPRGMAIILATEDYDDGNYPKLEYANRDGITMREYFQNAFGLSDYQLLPSKPWQMEGGPTLNDFINIFDPHQGDLRRRIINSNRYSGVEEVDVIIYLRGLGEWIEGDPYIIPKDAKFTRDVTKFSLDRFVKDLSVLSVVNSIQSITLFLDVTFTNPSDANKSAWEFPEVNKKICILSASSKGESSQLYPLKKHSLFLYSLLKGLSNSDDDGDAVVELGELTDFVYKTVPKELRGIPNASRQNPTLYGIDLKRTILDLR